MVGNTCYAKRHISRTKLVERQSNLEEKLTSTAIFSVHQSDEFFNTKNASEANATSNTPSANSTRSSTRKTPHARTLQITLRRFQLGKRMGSRATDIVKR